MGCKELIEALRASGEEKIGAIRAEAEREARKIRADALRRIEAVRAEQERRKAGLAAGLLANHTSDAQGRIRRMMLVADKKLADRLYALARSSLGSLRNVGYADVFRSFASELPPAVWQTVRVNPADAELAGISFSGVEIVPSADISGGMIAESSGDVLRVDNTFEKRLERAWEEILPEIMNEVKELCS